VDPAVAQRLLALNDQFYQRLAAPFSASRGRLQPGVIKVLEELPAEANVLDLGCGNGGVARQLAQRGQRGRYVGVDISAELLEDARRGVEQFNVDGLGFKFVMADLAEPFNQQSEIGNQQFAFAFAFAVLHHIPSRELRLGFLRQVKERLTPGGRFVLSNWQFMNSPRLRARIQPWAAIGLEDGAVDTGDYLLDWRSGGSGLRYVHHFDEAELGGLAAEAGFTVADSFLSDGKDGKLALYQTWERS
jgi:SAM-dependent methyltransferase